MTARKKPGPKKGEAGPRRGPTPQRHADIVAALEAGTRVEDAAALAGIGRRTLYAWLARGKTEQDRIDAGIQADPGEELYLQLWHSATRARAAVKMKAMGYWIAAFENDWRAARDFAALDVGGMDITSGDRLERVAGELTAIQSRVVLAAMRSMGAILTATAVDALEGAGVDPSEVVSAIEAGTPDAIRTALAQAEAEVHEPALEAG
jgi:hypothetical protein